MRKDEIDRLNDVLDAIPALAARHPGAFTGLSPDKLRDHLFKTLQKDPYLNLGALSSDLSFGGLRIIKTESETRLRMVKRLTLLVHALMGYHSNEQTQLFKQTIEKLDEAGALRRLSEQLARGVQLMQDSLQDWMVKTLAVDNGRLVHYYDQGEDRRLEALDLTENGWCLGVSTHWLRFKATGTDFWSFQKTSDGAAACRFVMAAQGVRTGLAAGLGDRAAFALKAYGLTKVRTAAAEGDDATPQAMALNILSEGGALCRIGQSYVDGGGHAMAAFLHPGGVNFMDPNAGEVQFGSGTDLVVWLPKFVRRMGYHFSRHYVEKFVYSAPRERQGPVVPDLARDLAQAMQARRRGMGYPG